MDILTFGIDASLAVLALLVQAIIYPTLRHVDREEFASYHAWYTRRISWFVGPLMIGQVIAYGYRVVTFSALADLLAVALVLAAWLVTGIKAVPLHAKLAREGQSEEVIAPLLSANAIRTAAWVLILLLWSIR